jgi:uncharacterized coiled-coil protein SlyX
MEQYQEPQQREHQEVSPLSGANRWLVVAAIALLGVAGIAFGYGYRQQILVGHLTAQEKVADATLNDLQAQVNTLTAKLNEMTAAQAAAQVAAPHNVSGRPGAKTAAAKRTAAPVDKRYKQLQAQLAEQQKQMKETQDLVARNRSDIESSINSTRDDLKGSIARTHEEVVALAKRGERSYFEFDLTKSKQFQRFGPLTLSLRKADTKHKSYDLEMIVDDNHLNKKKVNLYEPIWIHTENDSQPVQIVVNRIEKNLVHGYVSAPKYKASELSTVGSTTTPPSVTPVSEKIPAPAQTQSPAPNPPPASQQPRSPEQP